MRSTSKGRTTTPFIDRFNVITEDFEFRCSSYAVAYQFLQFLKQLHMCVHTEVLDDYKYDNGYPVSDWVIFFTCLPRDAIRMKYVMRHIPSSIKANPIIKHEDDELEEFYA